MDRHGLQFFNIGDKEAVIEIYGIIGYEGWDKKDDENTARLMAAELDRVQNLKAESITVKINSLGGNVNHALAIHDLLADHPATVTTQINGLCASAATIIAMAGTVRKMSKNALFLAHKCSANPGRVNENRLLEELESQRTVNARILSIYADICGKDKDIKSLLEANSGNGKWITARQALDYGFISDIYNETAKAACISRELFTLSALPALPEGYSEILADDAETPSFRDEAPQSFLDAIKELFSRTQKNTQNTQNTQTMKTLYPFIASFIGEDTPYAKEKGHLFSDAQLQNLEKQLGEFSDLKTANQKLAEEKSTLENSVATLTKERDDFKAIIDKIPGQKPGVDGKDISGQPENSFSDWQKKNTYYQSISEEL
ncbi:Clp protease ClpP [Bacteroidales bacterium OttesenSCG-928-B11]|nr:Clp protease ClpP [Bacteroidales bacterium OttesenSCG-928-E04]MDL2312434.1 Clp protease ClpP [Bacteroidales bacterium OttesenSCG-928-B11]